MQARAHPEEPQRTVLITGASSGIGLELATVFAREGHRPVLVARRHDELVKVAQRLRADHGIEAEVLACDLGEVDAARTLVDQLDRRHLAVDMLVNNAGFATRGFFATTDVEHTQQLLTVNVVTLTTLTRFLLPHMLQQRYGKILNVASIAGFFPGPLTATYNASKAFVVSFTEALANELRGTGVSATALCPGPTRTGFEVRAGLSGTKAFSGPVMDAVTVAEMGYRAMMKGRTVAVPGLQNRLRMLPVRLVPRWILAHFARQFHEAPQDAPPS